MYAGMIPGVGSMMLASFPSHTFSTQTLYNLWYALRAAREYMHASVTHLLRWMGEKYDGIRFCWNPDIYVMYPPPFRTM